MPIPTGKPAQHHRVLLRDMVRERIRDAIMDGTLRPGEGLRDEDLQKWLGVSRTPIRDAVNELARAGLIEMAPNRYTRVATPSEGEAITAYHTLGVLLSGAVRLAVPRFEDADRDATVAILSSLAAAARGGDFDTLRDWFMPLFVRYIERCGNQQLIHVCNDTIDGLAYKVRTERMRTLVDQEAMADAFDRLREATAAGRAIDAARATERVFLLPED